MTQSNKLKALIEKAIEGGWNGHWYGVLKIGDTFPSETETYQLLFNKDFARALFGEKINTFIARYERDDIDYLLPKLRLENWEYHMQQAVISDNPIDYYYEQVFGGEG